MIEVTNSFRYNYVCCGFLFRGVAQLVARLLWEQDVGSSSLFTSTTFPLILAEAFQDPAIDQLLMTKYRELTAHYLFGQEPHHNPPSDWMQ